MKAFALISGGLDSILAARLIQEQGIEVIPLNFKIPFSARPKKKVSAAQDKLKQISSNLGVALESVDIGSDFLKLILKPRHGFGANINPCIDCKILMLKRAKELMGRFSASFVVTGEVLAQRPMSQHRKALALIGKESGLEGLLLRPLSAKLLDQTIPEKEGWVCRDKLLAFSGRSRRPQIELASKLGVKDYPNAAGGCLLTDPIFTGRLKDLISHQEMSLDNIELLKVGRHFRLSEKAKLVVGRSEEENKELLDLAREGDYLFFPGEDLAGPTSLARGDFNEALIGLSSALTCRYCDLGAESSARINYQLMPGKEKKFLEVQPIASNELAKLRL